MSHGPADADPLPDHPSPVEAALRVSRARLRLGYELLQELARRPSLDDGGLAELIRRMTEAGARILDVARVGVWLRGGEANELRPFDVYDRRSHSHEVGEVLTRERYPAYFAALDTDRVVAVADARTDPGTRELAESYLAPHRIASLLDAPIRLDERVVGVVCHEHDGAPRQWTREDRDGACALADLVALALKARQRREDEARLREQAALLDAASDAIMALDPGDRIIFWSRGAERLYGWRAADVLGRRAATLLHPGAPDIWTELVGRVLEQGAWSGELQHATASGTYVVVESRWSVHRHPDGSPRCVLVIATDVTERRRLEAQLRRAQRLESIGMLAGGIAHDLNNVLTPILASVGLLLESETDPARRAVLETLEETARHGGALVRQVLLFARGAEGDRELVPTAAMLRQVDTLYRRILPPGIELQLDLDGDLWAVVGDPTQLQQVLVNLIVNSADAMPSGGRITVTARNELLDEGAASLAAEGTPGPYVRIAVTDTGLGMTADVLEHAFDPFFTTKDPQRGTGLGLSTTLGIVRSHGGFITVSSEAGRGTEFVLHLPAEPLPAPEPSAPVRPTAAAPRAGALVLVVDDDPAIREIVGRILEGRGYRVIRAADGSEALAQYAEHRSEVAVVLTDMVMPVLDGRATIAALQKLDPDVRIVAMSGLVGARTAAAEEPRVRHVLEKPFTAQALLAAVAAAIAEPGG